MKMIIKLEEAALTAFSIYFLTKYNLGLPFGVWILLFFSPDLSMIGYLIDTRTGAYIYNFFHHRGIALLVVAVGMLTAGNILIAIGILIFAHSSFDRMLGFGLKYTDDFKHTHLGLMGQEKQL